MICSQLQVKAVKTVLFSFKTECFSKSRIKKIISYFNGSSFFCILKKAITLKRNLFF